MLLMASGAHYRWIAIALIAAGFAAGGRALLVVSGAQQRDAKAASSDVTVVGMASADHDALPLPLLIVEPGGRIVASNSAARSAFEPLADGSLLLLKFRSKDMRNAFEFSLAGKPSHFEMHDKVPLERWMRVDVCPVKDAQKVSRVLVLFRDVSEAHRIDRVRADFVANASHELRTPLASLSGFIETLKGPARKDEPARDRFLGIMQDQASRMSRLIDDLLSLSRLESRSMTDDAAILDLADVVREVADAMQPLADAEGIRLERDIAAGAVWINGMRDELVQAVQNLTENAIKYGRSGGRVILFAGPSGQSGDVCCSVRDFGQGVAEEHIPRLTERFYRAGTQANAPKGTGLGLAIVKHIVTRHNGRLSIVSKPGKGSTFAIYLPAVADDGAMQEFLYKKNN